MRHLDADRQPHRVYYAVFALLLSAFAVYGSLVPLHYTPLPWHEALQRFGNLPYLRLGIDGRADWVSNILLFLPLGYLWLAVLTVHRPGRGRRMRCAVLVVVLCTGLSIALEFAQLWFPPRTVSQNDILAEMLGGLLGAGLWLMVGQAMHDWLRTYRRQVQPKQQLDWLLEAYALGFLVYALLPLDLTISPGELVEKYRSGKIVLLPLADLRIDFETGYGMFRDLVTALPLGMLITTWQTPRGQRVRPIMVSILLGGLLASLVEIAQVFVYSRYTSTTDVLIDTLGMSLGILAAHYWRGRGQVQVSSPMTTSPWKRTVIWFGVAGLYSLFLALVFCAPFHPILQDRPQLKERFLGFWCVPFAALYQGSEFNSISEVIKKGLFFAPLGLCAARAVAPLAMPRWRRGFVLMVLLLAAAGVATGNETPRSKLRGIRRKRYLNAYAASCGESHPARD